jgi:hypothetical protein
MSDHGLCLRTGDVYGADRPSAVGPSASARQSPRDDTQIVRQRRGTTLQILHGRHLTTVTFNSKDWSESRCSGFIPSSVMIS